MTKTFYTADNHMAHTNIIRYCQRPFPNYQKMDNAIVNKWNSVVERQDKVIIVGDFSMRRAGYREWYEELLKQLNGRKILVLGNHNSLKPFTYVNIGFESVHTSLLFEDEKIFVAHDPAVAVWMPPGYRMICGHIHNSFKLLHTPNIIVNVGVDVWDFYPVSQNEINACFEAAELKRENNG